MWLFNDLGKPLVGPRATSKFMATLPNHMKWNAKIQLSTHEYAQAVTHSVKFLLQRADEKLAWLREMLDELPGGVTNYLGDCGFVMENYSFSSQVTFGDLPWSNTTWNLLTELGFDNESSLLELDSLQWREILGKGSLETLLEILHTVYDWADFASTNDLLIPKKATLNKFGQFANKMLFARAGEIFHPSTKWKFFLTQRYGFGVEARTLEAIGRDMSLSGERVRQIETRYVRQFARVDLRAPSYLVKMLEPSRTDPTSKDSKNSNKAKCDSGWTQESKDNLGRLYLGEGYMALRKEKVKIESDKFAADKLRSKQIQNYRAKLGVIRLSELESFRLDNGLSKSGLLDLILLAYPRSLFSGDVVIARNQNNLPMILNVIIRQLRVKSPLHIEVLAEGVRKVGILRKCQNYVPKASELAELLKSEGSYSVDERGFVALEQACNFTDADVTEDSSKETESTTDWLVMQLSASAGLVSHKSTLMRLAASSGLKFGTVSMSIQYAPELRAPGKSLVSLVGSLPSEQDMDFAEQVAKLGHVKCHQSNLRIDSPTNFSFACAFSTQFMIGGVMSITSQIARLLGNESRKVFCCDGFVSESNAKLSGSSLLAGLAGAREHLWNFHGVKEGNYFSLEISPAKVQVLTD